MSTGISSDRSIREAYEADASGLRLLPEIVARPETPADVIEIVKQAARDRTPITCAGGQTSTTAASITDTGILLSLRALNEIGAVDEAAKTITAGPGAMVGDVKRAAAEANLLFAPDPTSEDDSTVGGAIACNASGARTYKYGATRKHIKALQVVVPSGELMEFRRTELEKNTVGYAFAHDPIDWFIGSEGTLGIIVGAELSLLPLPDRVVGVAIPFHSEADALSFVVTARESPLLSPRCIEFFDATALGITQSAEGPEWPEDAQAMVYIEQEIAGESDVLGKWLDLVEKNGSDMEPLVFDGESQLREARRIRHSVPATMNERGSKGRAEGGRKLSTDWAVPYRHLGGAIAAARAIVERRGLAQPVIYGHAGNGHPHENFLARDGKEVATIEEAIEETLRVVLELGGTVAAEHGIGKIKRRWLPLQMNPLQIAMMTAVKRELDPHGMLAPGNIL